MSSLSIPSSPESVTDEDNKPKARPWYEPDWTPEELGLVPVESPKPTTVWVHHPDPVLVDTIAKREAKLTEEQKNLLRKKEEKAEERELERDARREARREEKALRRRIIKRRENEMEKRAAEWK